MNIKNNMKNFLYDQSYFISMFENHIHIFNYEKIIKFSDEELIFEFINFKLNLKGEELLVKRMLEKEILIKGIIKSLNISYE